MKPGLRVFVSAGASGIGLAISEMLIRHGARVHICDVAETHLAAFRKAHPGHGATLADVSDEAAVARLFGEVTASLGGLDALINNAGIAGPTGGVEEISPADWRRCIDVCLTGQFLCAHHAVPMLKAAGSGSIVLISSSAAFFGYPLRTPYTACKWALIGFMKTIAMELGPQGIRVNAICPGSVRGPRIDGVIERDAAKRGLSAAEIRRVYERQTSLRSFVSAEDIANAAFFLASDQGAMISGQALSVDGHTEGLSNWLD